MALVLDWKKKLGYSHDPFEHVVPSPVKQFAVGLEDLQEKINLFLIREDQFGIVTGEKGAGKTTFLRWLDEELNPSKTHQQLYFDAKHISKRAEIVDALLQPQLSIFEKTVSRALSKSGEEKEKLLLQKFAKQQKNVLLVDNASMLTKDELDLFKNILEKTPTHLIFSDTEERIKRMDLKAPFSDKLHARLPEYKDHELLLMLQCRIEDAGGSGIFPFDEKELHGLSKRAGSNPAKLLELAHDRAVELSLKVQTTPPKLTGERAVAAKEPASSGKKKFFSITIEKKPKKETITTKDGKRVVVEDVVPVMSTESLKEVHEIKTEELTVPPATAVSGDAVTMEPEQEAEALSKVISEAETKTAESKKREEQRPTQSAKAVEDLAKELIRTMPKTAPETKKKGKPVKEKKRSPKKKR